MAETLEGRLLLSAAGSSTVGAASESPAVYGASAANAGTRSWTSYGAELQVGQGQTNRLRVGRATTNESIGRATATIDWGDGVTTAGTVAVFAIDYAAPPLGDPIGVDVVGEHTYDRAGVYSVRATIRAEDGTTTTVTSRVVSSPGVTLSGKLDPASDTGVSNVDGITAATQPRFVGIAPPLSTVQLSAVREGAGGPFGVGQGAADAQGNWSITTTPLAEGVYTITATVFAADGRVESTAVLAAGETGGPLVVDTTGPRIVGVAVDAPAARIQLEFGDGLAGLDPRGVGSGALTLQRQVRARAQGVVVQPLSVGPAGTPVRFSLSRPLQSGRYTLRLQAAGVRDLAGNALDGEFAGAFATGDGRAGGDFAAWFQVARRQALPLQAIVGGPQAIRRTKPGRAGRG